MPVWIVTYSKAEAFLVLVGSPQFCTQSQLPPPTASCIKDLWRVTGCGTRQQRALAQESEDLCVWARHCLPQLRRPECRVKGWAFQLSGLPDSMIWVANGADVSCLLLPQRLPAGGPSPEECQALLTGTAWVLTPGRWCWPSDLMTQQSPDYLPHPPCPPAWPGSCSKPQPLGASPPAFVAQWREKHNVGSSLANWLSLKLITPHSVFHPSGEAKLTTS